MDTPVVRRSTRRRTPTQTNSTPTPNPTRSRRKSKKTKTEEEEEKKKSSNDAKAEEDNNQVDVPVEKDDKQVNNTKRGRKRKTSDDKPSSPILKADSNGEKDKEVVPNKRKRRSTSVSASASKKTSKRTSRRTPSKEVAREGPVNTEELAEGTTQSKTASPSSLSGKKKERDMGPIEDRTCPFCNKVFSIIPGLAYHVGKTLQHVQNKRNYHRQYTFDPMHTLIYSIHNIIYSHDFVNISLPSCILYKNIHMFVQYSLITHENKHNHNMK